MLPSVEISDLDSKFLFGIFYDYFIWKYYIKMLF